MLCCNLSLASQNGHFDCFLLCLRGVPRLRCFRSRKQNLFSLGCRHDLVKAPVVDESSFGKLSILHSLHESVSNDFVRFLQLAKIGLSCWAHTKMSRFPSGLASSTKYVLVQGDVCRILKVAVKLWHQLAEMPIIIWNFFGIWHRLAS